MRLPKKKPTAALSVALCALLILGSVCLSIHGVKAFTRKRIDALLNKRGEEYYAYMILDEADAALKPVILEARWRIISRESWVADDLNGTVTGGGVSETVPHFHDIFPADWEIQPGRGTY